jgi:glycosyltransferase involved in cell wall biosynthesis
MRIVYLVSLFPCWSETFIVREIRGLLEAGVDVRIVSLRHPSETFVQPEARAMLERVVYPPRGLRAVRQVLGELVRGGGPVLADTARAIWALRHDAPAAAKTALVAWRTLAIAPRLRAIAPAHLHAHWATYPSTAAMLLSRILEVPFSFTAHAHDIFVNDHLIGDKLARARFGVTISEFNVDWLRRIAPANAGAPLHVIHCGVPLEAFGFVETGRDRRTVLSVGRLDEIKGLHHLVDACARLAAEGIDWRCRIVGDGPLRGALAARIRAAGLQDRIELLGALDQAAVRTLVAGAGVFALPCVVARGGDRDGIPVALMEAMASGLPVVSTRVSGVPELIEDGANGLLVAPGDADGLAAAIARLLADEPLARRLARAARQTVEQGFDARKEAAKLLALIRHSAAQRPGATGPGCR